MIAKSTTKIFHQHINELNLTESMFWIFKCKFLYYLIQFCKDIQSDSFAALAPKATPFKISQFKFNFKI